jgi:hypothetical protein
MVGAGLHECKSDFSRGCKSLNWLQTLLQVLMVQHAPVLPQQHVPLQLQLAWAMRTNAAAGSSCSAWPFRSALFHRVGIMALHMRFVS